MYRDAALENVLLWIAQYDHTSVWSLTTFVCYCLGVMFDDMSPIIVV